MALQECERMNNLTNEIKRSLKELNLGLRVFKKEFFTLYVETINSLRKIFMHSL